jgi:hypothetical protein
MRCWWWYAATLSSAVSRIERARGDAVDAAIACARGEREDGEWVVQGWLAFKIGEGRRGNGGTEESWRGRARPEDSAGILEGGWGRRWCPVVVVACFMRVWLFLNSDVGIWRGSLWSRVEEFEGFGGKK